jgi:Flp pilus assembly pilin Flp
MTNFRAFLRDRTGATTGEQALVITLVAIALLGVLAVMAALIIHPHPAASLR